MIENKLVQPICGLTKREYFAAMLIQRNFSNSKIAKLRRDKRSEEDFKDFSEAADALLIELENNPLKPQP